MLSDLLCIICLAWVDKIFVWGAEEVWVDDIFIWGANEAELLWRLGQVLQRLLHCGLYPRRTRYNFFGGKFAGGRNLFRWHHHERP